MSSDDSSQRLIDFTPATRFYPPNRDDTPQTLFTLGDTSSSSHVGNRFLRHSNSRQILIYTDGSCLYNGHPNAVGGCAFVFKGGQSPKAVNGGIISFRLEDRGPSGVVYTHTSNRAELRAVIACLQYCLWNSEGCNELVVSNRAELRAVIACLQYCLWNSEGCNELVVATDSEYVVLGATKNVTSWVRRGWKTCKGTHVKNTDLWEMLFQEIQSYKESHRSSLRVLFWHIPREWNTVADRGAKEAAATGEPCHSFTRKVLLREPIFQVEILARVD